MTAIVRIRTCGKGTKKLMAILFFLSRLEVETATL